MKTRLLAYVLICALIAGTTGCPRLHSPGQEELAHDVQERYKTLTPSAVQALEGLDADLEKLIESQRADFEIYKETSESQLATTTWSALLDPKNGELKKFEDTFSKVEQDKVGTQVKAEEDAVAALEKQSAQLAASIKELNEGLKKAQKASSLKENLDEAKRVIDVTLTSVSGTLKKVQQDPKSPLSQSLSITVQGLDGFLTEVKNKPELKDKDRVFSLVIEGMRLGRDIAVLEKEVVDQEASYHKNVVGLLKSKKALMPNPASLMNVRECLAKRYPMDELIQARVVRLAYEAGIDEETTNKAIAKNYEEELRTVENYKKALATAQATGAPTPTPPPVRVKTPTPSAVGVCDEDKDGTPDPRTKVEELRDILNVLARVQSLRLTNDMRIKELELRIAAEKYRNAKLKEAIFERQRMTLVSFGLVGVVRYAEGGLRSEDIANLINITRAIAEGVIAARI